MSETETQLTEVNAAISKILSGGQSYKIGSRSLTRADLSELYKMKKELEAQAKEESGAQLGRAAALVYFDGR